MKKQRKIRKQRKSEGKRGENNKMIIVSACLAGICCKYNGKSNYKKEIAEMVAKGKAIPICPEQLGGMSTPRDPCEISGGTGKDVLSKKCKVITKDGEDVTQNLIKGAWEVMKIAKLTKAQKAILKSDSPSCSSYKIYNGTFSKTKIKGSGVTAQLLIDNGIEVMNE